MKSKQHKPFVKKVRAWHKKSPLLAVTSALAVVVVLGGTSYGTYQYFNGVQDEKARSSSVQNANTQTDDDQLEDVEDDTRISSELKATQKQPTSTTTPSTSEPKSDPRAPGPTTGAGCAGIACYSLGGFSIVASPKTVTLHAGENSGPILLKTTDGSKVDWGGMPEDSGMVGSFAQTFPGYSSSFEYYVAVNEAAKPGTYHLEFYATKEKNKQWAKTTVTVTVAL